MTNLQVLELHEKKNSRENIKILSSSVTPQPQLAINRSIIDLYIEIIFSLYIVFFIVTNIHHILRKLKVSDKQINHTKL